MTARLDVGYLQCAHGRERQRDRYVDEDESALSRDQIGPGRQRYSATQPHPHPPGKSAQYFRSQTSATGLIFLL